MRWEALFDDLEAQLAQAEAAADLEEVRERIRAERAGVGLADRFREGGVVRVRCAGGLQLAGEVLRSADSWVLLRQDAHRMVVPSHAISWATGLGRAGTRGAVERRLTIGHALRAIAIDRTAVRVVTQGGEVIGRIDAVGADHFDVARAEELWRDSRASRAVRDRSTAGLDPDTIGAFEEGSVTVAIATLVAVITR